MLKIFKVFHKCIYSIIFFIVRRKDFFSKIAPSLEGFSLHRWLKGSSGFHRPGNFLNVDGTIGHKEVWKVEVFHPGRNCQSVDGINSHEQLEKPPSAQKLINSRCRGKEKCLNGVHRPKAYLKSDGSGSSHREPLRPMRIA